MRKGQKVRLLADDTIGTIADSTFFKLNGQKHIRYLVVTRKNKQGCWYPADKLGDVKALVNATIRNEDNKQEMYVRVCYDYEKKEVTINMTGKPENLKEHTGLHVGVAICLIDGIKGKY